MKWILRSLSFLMIVAGIWLMAYQVFCVSETPQTELLHMTYRETISRSDDLFYAGAVAAAFGILASFPAWMGERRKKEKGIGI